MADQLPQVLVLRPPESSSSTRIETQLSQKFQLLKAWESPLPTADFLAVHAASIKAMLCSGGTPVTAHILHLLPSLQLIVTTSAGLNHINLPECRRRSIAVANAGQIFSQDCADLAVGILIDVLRKISAADRFIRAGIWRIRGNYPLGSKVTFLSLSINVDRYDITDNPSSGTK